MPADNLGKTIARGEPAEVKDPVCGMTVSPGTASGKMEYRGKTYYFCNPSCMERFRESPDRYLASGKTLTVLDEGPARQRDPVCGMMVNPAAAAAQLDYQGKTYYFCCKSCYERFATSPDHFLHPDEGGREPAPSAGEGDYACPMHSEVRSETAGVCNACGMALEPPVISETTRIEYICPMDPEVKSDHPGSCPVCGMALEPRTITLEEQGNPELDMMKRRFWVSCGFTVPVLLIAMGEMLFAMPFGLPHRLLVWIQFVLATPVVIWGGWPFFQRGWNSIVTHNLNMFTLIAVGTGTAYLDSLVATLFPWIYPDSFRGARGATRRLF